jgi:EAL domain-containing protein (putative c-di-GMP-specific phosphodiesterase class I)
VLLRWPHPQHGFIPPDQFIPLAEHTGLIGPLTQWVLDEALRQCAQWQRSGLMLAIQVNLSMRSLHDITLPKTVASLLDRHQVSAEYLTLEITESALMVDPGRALDVLTRLAEIGVRVAIDDFGTGYSSLGYLKRLPVHEVKIDKSFVLGMGDDGRDEAIVRSVVAMAHALGLEVVAEGVENRTTWDLLLDLKCETAQGYYMCKPLPPAELEIWLQEWAYGTARISA